MIFISILQFVVAILAALLSWLPNVSSLPTVLGVDVDANMINAMSYFYSATDSFWPVRDLFIGVLFYTTYLGIKLLARLMLGHRAPG